MNKNTQPITNWKTPKSLSPNSNQEQQPYPLDSLPEIIKAPVVAYQKYG